MKFCFATGALNKFDIFENKDKVLDIYKQYDFYGGELTFGPLDEYFTFSISEENKEYLRNLEYLSLHLPYGYYFKRDDKTERIIDRAIEMIDDFEVDNVVIHPHRIEDSYHIDRIKIQKCLENLPSKRGLTLKDYRQSLHNHPGYMFVLDTTHALCWSESHLRELYNELNEYIAQVHYSEFKEGKHHVPVHHNFNNLLPMLEKLDVPIVLETDYDTNDYESFIKDMQFIGLK